MSKIFKNKLNNQIVEKLVLENCMTLGQHPKFTQKNITKYIFGTRHHIDIFKLYELRLLLLKTYPLIHQLFLQSRFNSIKRIKSIFEIKTKDKKTAENNDSEATADNQKPEEKNEKPKTSFKKRRILSFLKTKSRPFLPRILFATTNPLYADIIESAAKVCQMPFHQNRWLNGAITASSSYLIDKKK
jgi:ribosomal protein S2